MTEPQPGDFFVTTITGDVGKLISLGERLAGAGRGSEFDHAGIYIGGGEIVEAEPGGARIADVSEYADRTIRWSTGAIELDDAVRQQIVDIAKEKVGVGYSAADYFAIAAHRFHLWAPGLKAYINRSDRLICSQLTDLCYELAGVHLFSDNRWPGYVTPADLADLLEKK